MANSVEPVMMRTSVFCLPNKHGAPHHCDRRATVLLPSPRSKGFTLLELLVVMALLGLASSVAAPRVLGWAEAAQERANLDVLQARLSALPTQSFFAGKTHGLMEAADTWPLPLGWRLYTPKPVVYEASGMTQGGTVQVLCCGAAGQRLVAQWHIQAPAGQVRHDGPGQ